MVFSPRQGGDSIRWAIVRDGLLSFRFGKFAKRINVFSWYRGAFKRVSNSVLDNWFRRLSKMAALQVIDRKVYALAYRYITPLTASTKPTIVSMQPGCRIEISLKAKLNLRSTFNCLSREMTVCLRLISNLLSLSRPAASKRKFMFNNNYYHCLRRHLLSLWEPNQVINFIWKREADDHEFMQCISILNCLNGSCGLSFPSTLYWRKDRL